MCTVPRCILDEGRERQGRGEEGEGVGWDVGGVVVVVGLTAVAFFDACSSSRRPQPAHLLTVKEFLMGVMDLK